MKTIALAAFAIGLAFSAGIAAAATSEKFQQSKAPRVQVAQCTTMACCCAQCNCNRPKCLSYCRANAPR